MIGAVRANSCRYSGANRGLFRQKDCVELALCDLGILRAIDGNSLG